MKLNKIILICALSLFSVAVFPMPKDAKKVDNAGVSFAKFAAEAAYAYGVHYSISFYTVLAHELGHKIAARLLFGVNSTIGMTPTFAGVEGHTQYYGQIPQDFRNGFKSAAMSAAGPIFGVAAGYGILKLYNILYEYTDESKSIKNSIIDGIKKPLVNKDQSLKLKIAVGWNSLNHLVNLLPVRGADFVTDGAKIKYALCGRW